MFYGPVYILRKAATLTSGLRFRVANSTFVCVLGHRMWQVYKSAPFSECAKYTNARVFCRFIVLREVYKRVCLLQNVPSIQTHVCSVDLYWPSRSIQKCAFSQNVPSIQKGPFCIPKVRFGAPNKVQPPRATPSAATAAEQKGHNRSM